MSEYRALGRQERIEDGDEVLCGDGEWRKSQSVGGYTNSSGQWRRPLAGCPEGFEVWHLRNCPTLMDRDFPEDERVPCENPDDAFVVAYPGMVNAWPSVNVVRFAGKSCREVYESEKSAPAGAPQRAALGGAATMAMAPCWCPAPYQSHGPYARCPKAPGTVPPAPKPALTEERVAALTLERDRDAYARKAGPMPPFALGPGLLNEDIRRVCPTCARDVPAYLARCKCGALDRPVYRFMGGR